ncbi:hypothetical protein J7L05_09955 [bacterium]|nr:hypothetical protein [bacterium]
MWINGSEISKDLWSALGENDCWYALLPVVFVLAVLGIIAYKKRKEDCRLSFLSYSFLLLATAFFLLLLKFQVRVYSYSSGSRVTSINYPILNVFFQFLIFLFLVSFIFLIISYMSSNNKLLRIKSIFKWLFPALTIFISWLYIYLNMRLFDSSRPGLKGIFDMLFDITNNYFRVSYIGFPTRQIAVVILCLYFICIFRYLWLHYRNSMKLYFPIAASALLLVSAFVFSAKVSFLDFEMLFNARHVRYSSHHMDYFLIHLAFWIVMVSWFTFWRFKSPLIERVAKAIAIGISLGSLIIILLLPQLIIGPCM